MTTKHTPTEHEVLTNHSAAKLADSLDWAEKRGQRFGYVAHYEGHTLEVLSDDDGWDWAKDWDRACTVLFFGGSRHTGEPWPAGYKGPVLVRDKAESEDEFWETVAEDVDEKRDLVEYDKLGAKAGIACFASRSLSQYQDGFAYLTKEAVHKEWGKGPQAYKKARRYLEAVLKELGQIADGDVWGYQVEGEGVDESCWGFVGLAYAKEEACSVLLHRLKREKEEAAKIKACMAL